MKGSCIYQGGLVNSCTGCITSLLEHPDHISSPLTPPSSPPSPFPKMTRNEKDNLPGVSMNVWHINIHYYYILDTPAYPHHTNPYPSRPIPYPSHPNALPISPHHAQPIAPIPYPSHPIHSQPIAPIPYPSHPHTLPISPPFPTNLTSPQVIC